MKWEYKVITMKTQGYMGGAVDTVELEKALNSLGEEGWELACACDTNATFGRTGEMVVLFKRRKGTPR
jgi:hypothetical protein